MQKKLRCIAIDDHKDALLAIEKFIKAHTFLTLVNTYISPLKAFSAIRDEDDIDIIFMDIEMPEMDGITLAKHLRDKTRHLVFVTAFRSYALQSFSVSPDDYLLKPLVKLSFLECIARLVNREPKQQPHTSHVDENLFITIKNGRMTRISRADIIMIEPVTGTNYNKVYTIMDTYEIQQTLISIEHYLRTDLRFIRISRSCIINVNHISNLSASKVWMGPMEKQMSIGPDYTDLFDDYLAERMLGKSL